MLHSECRETHAPCEGPKNTASDPSDATLTRSSDAMTLETMDKPSSEEAEVVTESLQKQLEVALSHIDQLEAVKASVFEKFRETQEENLRHNKTIVGLQEQVKNMQSAESEQVKELKKTKNHLGKELELKQAENEQLREQLARTKTVMSALRTNNAAVERKTLTLLSEKDTLMEEIKTLKRESGDVSGANFRHTSPVEADLTLQQDVDKPEKVVAELEATLETEKAEVRKLEEQNLMLSVQVDFLVDETEIQSEVIQELSHRNARLESERRAIAEKEEISALNQQSECLIEEHKDLVDKLMTKNEEKRAQICDLKDELQRLKTQLSLLDAEVANLTSLNSQLEAQNVILSDQVDSLNDKNQKQSEEMQNLRRRLADLQCESNATVEGGESTSALHHPDESLSEKYRSSRNDEKRTEICDLEEELEQLQTRQSTSEKAQRMKSSVTITITLTLKAQVTESFNHEVEDENVILSDHSDLLKEQKQWEEIQAADEENTQQTERRTELCEWKESAGDHPSASETEGTFREEGSYRQKMEEKQQDSVFLDSEMRHLEQNWLLSVQDDFIIDEIQTESEEIQELAALDAYLESECRAIVEKEELYALHQQNGCLIEENCEVKGKPGAHVSVSRRAAAAKHGAGDRLMMSTTHQKTPIEPC